jgi:hypothetical protein
MDSTYYTTTTTTTTPEASAAIGMICLVIFILFVIPSLIVMWKLYKKAGKPGWAAIVPFYNSFVMADIAKLGIGWAIAAIFVPFVSLYVLYKFAQQYDRGLGFWLLVIFLPIVGLFLVGKANYTGGTPATQAMGPVPNPANTQPGAYGEMPQVATPQYQQPVKPTQPIDQAQPPTSYQPTQPGVQQPVQDMNQPNQTTPGGYPQA